MLCPPLANKPLDIFKLPIHIQDTLLFVRLLLFVIWKDSRKKNYWKLPNQCVVVVFLLGWPFYLPSQRMRDLKVRLLSPCPDWSSVVFVMILHLVRIACLIVVIIHLFVFCFHLNRPKQKGANYCVLSVCYLFFLQVFEKKVSHSRP